MIDHSLVIRGAAKVSKTFAVAAATIDARAAKVVAMYGQLLKTRIQAKASGRPGPNAPTGDYRRSWTVSSGKRGATHEAVVGTAKPQGRRLEYGFVGIDSLGRHYNQPPYKHVDPAKRELEPKFKTAMWRLGRIA